MSEACPEVKCPKCGSSRYRFSRTVGCDYVCPDCGFEESYYEITKRQQSQIAELLAQVEKAVGALIEVRDHWRNSAWALQPNNDDYSQWVARQTLKELGYE